MKVFVVAFFVLMSSVSFGEEVKNEPTLADTQSVLTEGSVNAPVASEEVCSDCKIRRRVFGRGYVVVKHEVSTTSSSTTREVLDACCNKVRSRTVTKNKCECDRCCRD